MIEILCRLTSLKEWFVSTYACLCLFATCFEKRKSCPCTLTYEAAGAGREKEKAEVRKRCDHPKRQ